MKRKCLLPLLTACFAGTVLPTGSDTITLKNGEVLTGKIVKEMSELLKVRLPRRGKIVTTFLNRGNITEIIKTPDEETRAAFKEAGVRNPGRDFTPIYYGGGSYQVGGAKGKGKKGAGAGKTKKKASERKRGIEGRQERFKSGISSRFGDKGTSGTSASSTSSGGAAPSTTGNVSSTRSSSGGSSVFSSSK
jgi:hypothetical protein